MQGLTTKDLENAFSFPEMRPAQVAFFEELVAARNAVIIEAPTGEGKTAAAIAALKAIAAKRPGEIVCYVTPTKAQVEQITRAFPNDTTSTYGRGDYKCLYYTEEEVSARDSPCYMLKCPHRVDMETGETDEPGAEPCPYFQAKYEALKAATEQQKILVCTNAFFILHRVKNRGWREKVFAAVVADECHRLADVTRNLFEYSFTDYNLGRVYNLLLHTLKLPDEAEILKKFLRAFRRMCNKRPSKKEALLDHDEIIQLIEILEELDEKKIESTVKAVSKQGPVSSLFRDRELLKMLENLTHNLRFLINGLTHSIPEEGDEDRKPRQPLNFVVAYYRKTEEMASEKTGRKLKVQYELMVRSYYVVPLIRLAMGNHVIAMSATIGEVNCFHWEAGMKGARFKSLPSSFPHENTRIYIPQGVPDLGRKDLGGKQYKRVLKEILERTLVSALKFSRKGHRSLIVVISEEERLLVKELALALPKLNLLTYGDGVTARDVANRFRNGEGDALVGTASQYGEGLDLPKQIAPVIFMLKPGYPHPEDPQAIFEERRFGGGVWALRQWRVMIRALQVRGRNIRSEDDLGVCFFLDDRFRKIVRPALPAWLQGAYRHEYTLDGAVRDAIQLLSQRS